MGRRDIYLDSVPVGEALARFLEALRQAGFFAGAGEEEVEAAASASRVTARPVFAARCSPHYHSAAMDGVAVRAAATFGATESAPLALAVGRDAFWIDTGQPLPEGCDAVIAAEELHEAEPGMLEITAAAVPWQHVRLMGEDLVAGELVLTENHLIRPFDVGAMLAAGVNEVWVRRRPAAAVIPTGSELVLPGSPCLPGQVIEFNSAVLQGMLKEWGAQVSVFPPVADDPAAIRTALREALPRFDIVIFNAGSSAGSRDFLAGVVREEGEILVHGAAVRPGKPVLLAVAAGKPVVGIPGYPVSAVVALELFVAPVVREFLRLPAVARPVVEAALTRRVVSVAGMEEFLRVKLGKVSGKLLATPLGRGAGLIASLARADGLMRLASLTQFVEEGEIVRVELLRPLEEIEGTLVVVGSHDVALDILSSVLKRNDPRFGIASAHVGSLGGLRAVARGHAHAAGIHLLDEESGEYNVPYVRRLLAGWEVFLVNLAYREQGLMVSPGNPKRIKGFADLAREDVSFVNRQRGAGTRILLDYALRTQGIPPGAVRGYAREEYTHLAVAAAVAGGTADAGLGIRAAANSLGLEFIPVAQERYDLAVPADLYRQELFARVVEAMKSPVFAREVSALGGYDLRRTGEIVAVVGGEAGDA